jgi:hypothetical protein
MVEPLYEQILRTKQPLINIEMSGDNPRKPGFVRHLTGSYFPLLDKDGEAFGIGAVIMDISDRKLAEAALQKSEQLYRTMASNFPNGAVMLFDREMRYTLVEGTELAAVGLSKELMEGKTIWEVFDPHFCVLSSQIIGRHWQEKQLLQNLFTAIASTSVILCQSETNGKKLSADC